ncbi:MAG: hypothetical protein ACTHNH_23565 [Mesorhizobium sp.]
MAEDLGLSRREALALVELDKSDFLIRGEAFGGPLDRVRICKPLTGKLGKDHMIEKLKLPVSPIEEVLALFGAASMEAGKTAVGVPTSPPLTGMSRPIVVDLVPPLAFEAGEVSIETLLLEILAAFGRGGVEKDSLALLAGETERRNAFQEAISSLLKHPDGMDVLHSVELVDPDLDRPTILCLRDVLHRKAVISLHLAPR